MIDIAAPRMTQDSRLATAMVPGTADWVPQIATRDNCPVAPVASIPVLGLTGGEARMDINSRMSEFAKMSVSG